MQLNRFELLFLMNINGFMCSNSKSAHENFARSTSGTVCLRTAAEGRTEIFGLSESSKVLIPKR